ncbi:hypothetical protein ABN306_13200 [Providencia huaxiensis]|uniref:O-antigen polymerase n=1 Tax=Providencia huaxiensis TaxID=2027290 RepID=A0ABU2J2C7_9GAMM|nr:MULTISPECIES: hypothetical protein [Providencia]MDT0135480.1 hypothetical protein [Providencia huaxiensis]MDT1981928.1 hypothetical protein [Providencia huaxiensis]QLR01186.1 hypothetical protein H0912_19295 [Providencia rettgeri]
MNFKTLSILLFIITPLASILNSTVTVVIIILAIILSLKNDIFFCCTVIAVTNFNGLMQLNGLPFLRFSVEIFIYFLMFIKIILLVTKVRIKTNLLATLVSLFILISIVSLTINGFQHDWLFIGLSIKDFILPLLSFFYFLFCFSKKNSYSEHDINQIINFMLLSIATVSALSIVNYIYPISINYNRFVIPEGLSDETLAASRSIGSLDLIRMQSLFGLSTQGAASCLYAISIMVILTGKTHLNLSKFSIYYIFFSCLIAGILSGAFTFYFTILLYLACFLYRKNKKQLKIFIYPLLILLIITFSFINIKINNNTEEINLIYYAYSGFIEPALDKFYNMQFYQLFIGIGLYPKLYWLNLGDVHLKEYYFRYIYDNWILGVFFQLGIIGGTLFVGIILRVFYSYKSSSEIYTILICSLISMLGFAHGTFIIDKLFIIKAMCLISLLIKNENFNNYNMQK